MNPAAIECIVRVSAERSNVPARLADELTAARVAALLDVDRQEVADAA